MRVLIRSDNEAVMVTLMVSDQGPFLPLPLIQWAIEIMVSRWRTLLGGFTELFLEPFFDGTSKEFQTSPYRKQLIVGFRMH